MIHVAIITALLLYALFLWRKYANKFYFWYAVQMAVLLVARIIEDALDTLLMLSENQKMIEVYILTSIRGVVLICFIVVGVRNMFFTKNN